MSSSCTSRCLDLGLLDYIHAAEHLEHINAKRALLIELRPSGEALFCIMFVCFVCLCRL